MTIHHDGVTIPVTRGGRGRPLVLCPGLLTTQDDLRELVELLRLDHEVVSFDLRGHGRSSPGSRYTFDAFLGDLTAVLATLDEPPLLVGHSLGADLAVHHAAEHPVAGLVLIDGANPVPSPFLGPEDLPEFRAMAAELAVGQALSAADILDLNLEIDAVRGSILDRFRRLDCPVTMIMSTSMAGEGGRAAWRNQNWRAGIERLTREVPSVVTHWLDAGHGLVVTHAREIARILARC